MSLSSVCKCSAALNRISVEWALVLHYCVKQTDAKDESEGAIKYL